jgi:hypothetical protein
MRVLFFIFCVLFQCSLLFGQDGGDINYIEPQKLNKSFIGRRLHLDFYKKSSYYIENRSFDIVKIEVNKNNVDFIEHRQDDGYNNWFSRQYLESVERIGDFRLRVIEFELLKINKKDILVRGFFVFVDKKGKIKEEKSFTQDLLFNKKDIIEYLFKAKD